MTGWRLRATGVAGTARIDAEEVRRALAVLADPEHGIQLQAAPGWGDRSKTFHAADLDGMVAWVKEQADATGVYYVTNPVPLTLGTGAKGEHVIRRYWFLIDVDRNKKVQPDDSATDDEHERARTLAINVLDYLAEQGWPAPVEVDSGNGFQLLYRVDLPNPDDYSKALLRGILKTLKDKFNGEHGEIGKECHNANRLAKMPGTMARRGRLSDDRPHRMCKLLHVPEVLEVVPFELLSAVPGAIQTKASVPDRPPAVNGFKLSVSSNDDGGRAYARAALRNECARVALAAVGDRNNTLFKATANMAELAAGGCILRQEYETALEFIGLGIGLEEREVRATLQSGWNTGSKKPRRPPEREPKTSLPEPLDPNARLTVRASEITPKPVDWLVLNRIPKRFITVFAGRTGLGKSFVTCDLIARMTTGREVPGGDGELFRVGNALLISEDPYEYVLVPRLMELGYDRERVSFMTWDAMASYTLNDIGMLDRAWKEAGRPQFVGIDPPTNFLGDTDEHKNAEVRAVLKRIAAWLVERDVAVVLITHVNKSTGKGVDAISRVMGSIAWMTSARIGHAFVQDPDDRERCLWVPLKTNLGPLGKGLAYRIKKTEALATVEWLGEVDTTAEEAMGGEKATPRRVLATQWMIELFREKREWPSADFWASAKAHGISENAIKEARVRLDLPKPRLVWTQDGHKSWTWWVPEDWPHLTEEEV